MSIAGTYADPDFLDKLSNYRMPFGKYSAMYLIDLPLAYLDWFSKKGFPDGELGQLMRIVHDVKSAGIEHILEFVRNLPSNH